MARPYAVRNRGKDNDVEERPSRSAKKRASAALQKLGEELGKLGAAELASLRLPQELLEALAMRQRITDYEGKRRQGQYIGRLMRELDDDAVARIARKLREAQKG